MPTSKLAMPVAPERPVMPPMPPMPPVPPMDRAALLACLGDWARGPAPLYLQLAEALRRAIERGDIPPGTRLPPERVLAGALAVSRGTVVAAYERLRRADLLESRQGSGSWTRHDAVRPLSTTNDYLGPGARGRRLAGRLFDKTDGVIDLAIAAVFGMAHLPEEWWQPPALARLEGLADAHGYQPLGLPELRQRIADAYTARGLQSTPDNVIVTGGAQQALSLVTELLLEPGDAVVVDSPTYPGALDVFGRAGTRLVPVPTDAWAAGSAALREAVTSSAARLVYLMPACHNPEGRVMSRLCRRDVARLADAQPVYVLEDNTLAGVVFEDEPDEPVGAFSSSGRVLSVGSLSKLAWGGLRIGWVRGSADLIDRLGRLKAARDFGLSVLPQLVGCTVLDHPSEVSARQVALLRGRRDVAQEELSRLLPDWWWREPAGGLALWVRLPFGDADEFVQLALRHGVDVTPGSAHTVDDSHQQWLRLAYGQQEGVLREGIGRLATAWRHYADGAASSSMVQRGPVADASLPSAVTRTTSRASASAT